MMLLTKYLFLILLISFSSVAFSQVSNDTQDIQKVDSTEKKLKKSIFKEGHDPAKAALMSAILPGAGQVYNKKYWKVPVVYAGLGGLGTWLGYNVIEYRQYTEAYKSFYDSDTANTLSYNGYTTETQINFKRKEFKRNMDVSAIALGIWYLLNIVDATVDAHLFDYNINDDISISWRPDVKMKSIISLNFEKNIYTGVKVQFHFK